MSNWRFVLSLLAGLLVAVPALAADSSTGVSSITWSDITDLLLAMKAAGEGMAGIFYEEGMSLGGAFATISIAWMLMLYALGPDMQIKADLIRYVIMAMTVLVMLNSWTTDSPNAMDGKDFSSFRISSNSKVTVKGLFIDSFDSLRGNVFSYKMSNGKAVVEGVTDVASMQTTVIKHLGNAYSTFLDGVADRQEQREKELAKQNVLNRIASAVTSAFDILFNLILGLIVFLMVLALIAAYLLVIFAGDLLAILALIMGPLMVPCMLFKPVSWIWESWLKFVIHAGFYKLVAAVIAVLTVQSVSKIQSAVNVIYAKAAGSGAVAAAGTLVIGDLVAFAMTVLYLVLGIWMMWKCHWVTEMIMSGRLGSGLNQMGINNLSNGLSRSSDSTDRNTAAVMNVANQLAQINNAIASRSGGGGGGQGGGLPIRR